MGFWSGLGKGLLGASGVIAAPFTGGASLATVLPAILGGVGAVASAASQGRAGGRVAEAGVNQSQDRNKLQAAQLLEQALQGRASLDLNQKKMLEDALSSRSTTDLNQRNFALAAPGKRATNSVRGDVLANAQDATLSGLPSRVNVPNISGGLRPSMMSSNTRQLGQSMSRDALLQQMAGDKFDAPPPMATFDKMPAPSIPSVTDLPQAGKLDTFLNILGGVGSAAGAIGASGLADGGRAVSGGQPGNPNLPFQPQQFAGWMDPNDPRMKAMGGS